MTHHRLHAAALVAALLAGCGDDDKTSACDLGPSLSTASSAVTVQDRKAIGLAAPYAPDLGLAAREDELRTSIAARRTVAWQAVERALTPVPLGDPGLAAAFGGQPSIPAWHTWYGRDDFERVFKKLYVDLGPAGRQARAPIDAQAGLAWNVTALAALPEWTEQRYLDYLAAVDTQEKAGGLSGVSRVGYSPGALAHLLTSYRQLAACRSALEPDPFDPSPARTGQLVTHAERLTLAACEWHALGPFQAGADTLTVTSRGTGDADLYVRRGSPPTPTAYDCRSRGGASDETCAVDGNGPVYAAVFAADASEVEVDVGYLSADVLEPTCLDGEMPRDAVLVKADWRRQLPGELMPVFDTSGTRVADHLDGDAAWNADGAASPPATDIYTVTLPSGARFRMPALHLATKELDHWLWITLWYSPSPDTDFGADRPASIAALPGPWAHYKMCVATSYLEGDPDPRGGFAGSLGDALAAVHGGVGAPTWCSNPYIELGAGNAATNCIGCHQHGGTARTAESILADEPHFGTTRTRNNFFTDYMWAVKGGGGEDLSGIVQGEIDYWDAAP